MGGSVSLCFVATDRLYLRGGDRRHRTDLLYGRHGIDRDDQWNDLEQLYVMLVRQFNDVVVIGIVVLYMGSAVTDSLFA